jgi:small subunit ribosomal protein S2
MDNLKTPVQPIHTLGFLPGASGLPGVTDAARAEDQTVARGPRGVPAKKEEEMPIITMKELLEAGVHFGHQTRRWNPKMKPYIFGARNGIHIIDLQKTVKLFKTAYDFISKTVADGYSILFVGTKKQAHDSIVEESERCGMFFVVNRWLGGTLTNFQTIRKSIARLKELEAMKRDGTIARYTKKEILKMEKEMFKLERNLGGIKDMDELPGAVFVVDPKRERIAVAEARKLGVPVIAIADSNCDPDEIDFIIPGNDDAIRAIRLICSRVADACIDGHSLAEERLKAEAALRQEQEAMEAKATEEGEEGGPEVIVLPKDASGETGEETEPREDIRDE